MATSEGESTLIPPSMNGAGPTTLTAVAWAPSAAVCTIPATFPDDFEVRVFSNVGDRTLVAVVELISPGNKDRSDERLAFANKCANYLHQGVSVVIIDIVTERRGNLHNETMKMLESPEVARFGGEVALYSVAYRPVVRGERQEIDCWPVQLQIGQPLPTMPLRVDRRPVRAGRF